MILGREYQSEKHCGRYLKGFLAELCLLAFISPGAAQSTFGSITGNVKDPSGASVASAAVEVIDQSTGAVRRVNSSTAGFFNVPNLELGTYKIRVAEKVSRLTNVTHFNSPPTRS